MYDTNSDISRFVSKKYRVCYDPLFLIALIRDAIPVHNAPSILSVIPTILKTYITIIVHLLHKKRCKYREQKRRGPVVVTGPFFFIISFY